MTQRKDTLPEYRKYNDTGCDYHPTCLTCPLVVCRFDVQGGLRAVLNQSRNALILGMVQDGVPVRVVAEKTGTSKRTIYRVTDGALKPPQGKPLAANGMQREDYNAYQREYQRKRRESAA